MKSRKTSVELMVMGKDMKALVVAFFNSFFGSLFKLLPGVVELTAT